MHALLSWSNPYLPIEAGLLLINFCTDPCGNVAYSIDGPVKLTRSQAGFGRQPVLHE